MDFTFRFSKLNARCCRDQLVIQARGGEWGEAEAEAKAGRRQA